VPGVVAPATGEAPANARDQAQQVQQQVKEALDAAAKARQMPDDN
jgi:predicted RNase H-like HicB family nuclease